VYNIGEIRFEDVDWVQLAQKWVQWRACVIMMTNLLV